MKNVILLKSLIMIFVLSILGILFSCDSPLLTIIGEKQTQAVNGNIAYDTISEKKGNGSSTLTALPRFSKEFDASTTVIYSIQPSLPDGPSIDPVTGKIFIPSSMTSHALTQTYTITARGTGAYKGTITTEFTLHIADNEIAGTFEYPETIVEPSSSATITPTWTGDTPGQTVEYSIETESVDGDELAGITIDATTGAISIESTAEVQDHREYTIIAIGIGTYAGTITGIANITIKHEIDGTLSYEDVSMVVGTETTIAPTFTGVSDIGQTIEYSVTPTLSSGLILDSDTGEIIIEATATATDSINTYTVTATGKGAYVGTETATVKIHLATATIDGLAHYEEVSMTVGTVKTVTPTFTGVSDAGQTLEYSVHPALSNGVTLDANTGVITIAAGATATNTEISYIVTAIGINAYVGTQTAILKLHLASTAIGGTFAYADTVHAQGTAGTIATTWTAATANQGNYLHYSIVDAPAGISIDASSGAIIIASTAAIQNETSYVVKAEGYDNFAGTISSSVKIMIANVENPIATSYNGTRNTDTGGMAILGPFIKEPVSGTTGALFADGVALGVTGLNAGVTYTYTLGSATGSKIANNSGEISILRSDLLGTDAGFNTNLTLTGGYIAVAKQTVARYTGSIYTWKDLQAMRQTLNGDYTLIRDITFPNAGHDERPTAGFLPVGTETAPFTGTLDGNSKTISSLFINRTTLATGTGLFGAIQGAAAGTEVVKNLTILSPTITGAYSVGGVAGILFRGTISGVTVDLGNIRADGMTTTSTHSNTIAANSSMVGGLVGLAFGGTTTGQHVSIIKSEIDRLTNVKGKGNMIGGLAGALVNGKVAGTVNGEIEIDDSPTTTASFVGGLVGYGRGQIHVVGYSRDGIGVQYNGANINAVFTNVGGLVGGCEELAGTSNRIIGFSSTNIEWAHFSRIGGLIGSIGDSSSTFSLIIRGYVTGNIHSAVDEGGGILGVNEETDANAVDLQGYFRGDLDIDDGMSTNQHGLIYGQSRGVMRQVGFTSADPDESILSRRGRLVGWNLDQILNTAGTFHGDEEVDITANNDPTNPNPGGGEPLWDGFDWGNGEGEWQFGGTAWPAVMLGSDMPSSAISRWWEQPIQ